MMHCRDAPSGVPAVAIAAVVLLGVPVMAGAQAAGAAGAAGASRTHAVPAAGNRPGPAFGAPRHAGPGDRVAAALSPELAMVQTTFTARLSVPAPTIDQGALDALEKQIAQSAASGSVSGDQTGITGALVDAIDANPLTYLVPTGDLQIETGQVTETGTAWFVTPDGYLVTPTHVVAPSDTVLTHAFEFQGLTELNNRDAQELATGAGGSLTSDQLAKLDDAANVYNAHNVTVSDVHEQVTVQTGTATAGILGGMHGVPATITYSQKDPDPAFGTGLALIKIDGVTGMPTIAGSLTPAGTTGAAGTKRHARNRQDGTENVFVAGYPSASDFGSSSSALHGVTVTATPALSSTVDAPWAPAGAGPAVTLDTPLTPGAAGEAVVDRNGSVTAMVVAPAGGQFTSQTAGRSLAVPTSLVLAALSRAHVTPSPSLAARLYPAGLSDWFGHRYSAAIPIFEQIVNAAPSDPYARHYLGASRRAVAAGLDETPVSAYTYALVGLVIAVALRLAAYPLLRGRYAARRPRAHRASVPGVARLYLDDGTPPLLARGAAVHSARRRGRRNAPGESAVVDADLTAGAPGLR